MYKSTKVELPFYSYLSSSFDQYKQCAIQATLTSPLAIASPY